MHSLTKNNFLNLIQLHVPLEEHGAMSSGFCPFCFDNEETFIAYTKEQIWNCFSCQQKGDITDFIEKTELLSKQDAENFIDQFIQQTQDTEEVNSEPELPESKLEMLLEPEPLKPEPLKPAPEVELIPTPKPESNILSESDIKPDIEEKSDKSPSINTNIKTNSSHSELNLSQLEVDNTEITISQSEFISSDPETIISDIDNIDIVNHLLATFHDCPGCYGISIIHNSDNKFIGSSVSEFTSKEILALNTFVINTLKLATAILGEFDNNSSKLLFRMNVVIKSAPKKLIWVPMYSKGQHKYNMLMLLDSNTSEKMLLIKLKNHLGKIDL